MPRSPDVTLAQYEQLIKDSARYQDGIEKLLSSLPKEKLVKLLALMYTTLGLVGEAGELANKVKKIIRDNDGVVTEEMRLSLLKETGDVEWYTNATALELGSSKQEVININHENLRGRINRGTVKGSGDDR